jgi:hypothetical protein
MPVVYIAILHGGDTLCFFLIKNKAYEKNTRSNSIAVGRLRRDF